MPYLISFSQTTTDSYGYRSVSTSERWEIVQIADGDEGEVIVWALLESSAALHSFRVSVPRTFYVNVSSPSSNKKTDAAIPECLKNSLFEEYKPKRVDRILPRGRPCLSLFQFQIPSSATPNVKNANERERFKLNQTNLNS